MPLEPLTAIGWPSLYGCRLAVVQLGSWSKQLTQIRIEREPEPLARETTWLTPGSVGVPRLGLLDGGFVYRLPRVGEFLVSRDGLRLQAYVEPDANPDILAWFLARGIVPRMLQLRGVPCLHAGAVATEKGIASFLGASGGGKSTVVAALVSRGFRLVGDDVLPVRILDAIPMGGPGLAEVFLYPSTARQLGLRREVRRRMPPATKVAWIPSAEQTQRNPMPVRIVYLLRWVHPGSARSPAARRGPILSQARAFRALMEGSMWVHSADSASLARAMPAFATIARSVIVRRLTVRLDSRGFDAAAAIVRDELAQMPSTLPAVGPTAAPSDRKVQMS